MNLKNKIFSSLLQINILICAIFAFAYILNSNDDNSMDKSKFEVIDQGEFGKIMLNLIKIIIDDSNFASAIELHPNAGKCVDSDEGKRYYLAGGVTSCPVGSFANSEACRNLNLDYCSTDGNRLAEYYCKTDGSGSAAFEVYDCPNGCLNGACINLSNRQLFNVNNKIATCLVSKNGTICAEYPSETCDEKCQGICIPSLAKDVESCKLGTCYDPVEGICQLSSPKKICRDKNNLWFDDVFGNIKECKRGCCVLKNDVLFTSSQECTKETQARGLQKDFRENINDYFSCIALAGAEVEGACVFYDAPLNACKFTTKSDCTSKRGQFSPGVLCSNKDLRTKCEPQKSVGCAPESEKEFRDEVYWYDGCGNRENIYDANKVKSFNDGKILSKEQSCSLNSGSSDFINQNTCGNCNRFLGSICGKKTASEFLDNPNNQNIDVVCRNINCRDENGNARANGESWCAYQGCVGIDKGSSTERSCDTPGSRHFRKTCINGEIITDACENNRDAICEQTKTPISNGRYFTTAACRANLGYLCYQYNQPNKKGQCEKNPDCFIKKINVAENFKFELCLSKYKPSFNLEEQTESAAEICNMGTMTCKYVKVKGLFSDDEQNKECLTEKFTNQMNDLCMSLGDCGASYNYMGERDSGNPSYAISNAPTLSKGYLDDIKRYSDRKKFPNKVVEAGSIESYFGILGIPGTLGSASVRTDEIVATVLKKGGTIAGAFGSLLPMIAKTSLGANALSSVGLASQTAALGQTGIAYSGPSSFISSSVKPALNAFGGALAGAAIGFSIASTLLSVTGVDRGLPPELTYSLLGIATVGGGAVGVAVMASSAGTLSTIGGLFAGTGPWFAVAGLYAIVAVVIFIIVCKILGVGEVIEKDVIFTCLPWQAPSGGKDCNRCGKEGLPCSRYSCSSLGQNCQIINEDDPATRACINIAPNDTISPIIKPLQGVLPARYRYEEFDFGVRIKSSDSDGCIKEIYTLIPSGIELNEPAQCGISKIAMTSFESMDPFGDNRYLINHSLPITIPSLESLGLLSFDPNAKADVNLYVRCQDKSGNKNERDYAISFCIKQGPDNMPPSVIKTFPSMEEINFEATEINESIFVNEPAECRWDVANKNYSNMANEFKCKNKVGDYTVYGFKCEASLPITKNESIFYVSCLDQPWLLGENASKRNLMPANYQIRLKKVANPLRIDSISPDNEILKFGSEPATIEVVVRTSGGLNGGAICSFKEFMEQLNSDSSARVHNYKFNQILGGEFKYTIVCTDAIGNTAERTAKVEIKIDGEVPKITRVFKDSRSLSVITDEPAKCVFSTDNLQKCRFEFSNGTLMNGENFAHVLEIDDKLTYYIKCKDVYNNGIISDACSIIVREGKI